MKNIIIGLIFALLAVQPSLVLAYSDGQTPPFYGEELVRLKLKTGYYYTESNFIGQLRSESLRQTLQLKEGAFPPFFHFMKTGFSLGFSPLSWMSVDTFLEGFWFAQSGNGQGLYFSSPAIKRIGGVFRAPYELKGVFGLIPELSFSYPFFPIDYNTKTPVTDSGVWHFTPSLWVYGVLFDIVRPFGYVGFRWRGQPLSSRFLWKTGLLLKADIAEIGFYVRGFLSATLDQSSGIIGDRINLLKRVNAGSLRFFSANPNMIGGTGWLAWHFPYFTLRLSGNMDFMGYHYSKGYGVLAEMIVKLGKIKKTRVQTIFNRSSSFTPDISSKADFVESSFRSAEKTELHPDESDSIDTGAKDKGMNIGDDKDMDMGDDKDMDMGDDKDMDMGDDKDMDMGDDKDIERWFKESERREESKIK